MLAVGAGVNAAHPQTGPQQRAGLGAMNGIEQRGVGMLALAFEIAHLAADHAAHRARGSGQFLDQRAPSRSAAHSICASTWNASVSSASPARIAMASPNTLWQVGTPRRKSSLSSAGRSS